MALGDNESASRGVDEFMELPACDMEEKRVQRLHYGNDRFQSGPVLRSASSRSDSASGIGARSSHRLPAAERLPPRGCRRGAGVEGLPPRAAAAEGLRLPPARPPVPPTRGDPGGFERMAKLGQPQQAHNTAKKARSYARSAFPHHKNNTVWTMWNRWTSCAVEMSTGPDRQSQGHCCDTARPGVEACQGSSRRISHWSRACLIPVGRHPWR